MAPKQASSNSPAGLMLALASDNTKKIKEQTNFKKKKGKVEDTVKYYFLDTNTNRK